MEPNQTNEKPIGETEWMTNELKELDANNPVKEHLPGFKLDENKIYEVEIDFSQPFEKWTDPVNKTFKKIIPLTYNGDKYNFWLSVFNPLYRQIMEKGKAGQRKFKIIRIGQGKATRYNLVN